MPNSLDLPRRAVRDPRGRRHVRRRRLVRGRSPPQARGLRRRRHHAAALRSRRRHPPQGRVLRRAGHPRRAPGRRGDRHPALRARLREPLPRGGDRPLRRELSRRRDADPVRRMQPLDQVPRPPGNRPGARRRRAGDRPLRRRAAACRTAGAPCSGPPIRIATRATSFTRRRPSSSPPCASRSANADKDETRTLARELGLTVADKADSQDICFVPHGRYSEVIERLKPGAVQPRRDRPCRRAGARPSRRHHPLHRRSAARARARRSASRFTWCGSMPERARVVVGPREALATRTIRLADVNWLGDGPLAAIGERGWRWPCACARRASRGRRCCGRRTAAPTVELLAAGGRGFARPGLRHLRGEAPRARVLGGGTIARAERGGPVLGFAA